MITLKWTVKTNPRGYFSSKWDVIEGRPLPSEKLLKAVHFWRLTSAHLSFRPLWPWTNHFRRLFYHLEISHDRCTRGLKFKKSHSTEFFYFSGCDFSRDDKNQPRMTSECITLVVFILILVITLIIFNIICCHINRKHDR